MLYISHYLILKTVKSFFRDSYLLLPSSLRKLAKSFNVINKSYFPFKFVNNSDNILNYVGPIPSIDMFDNISMEDYSKLSQSFGAPNNWNLKSECIKYCENDCITLHQIISSFNALIFSRFKFNINKFPTLPSLAFGIFRSKFLSKNLIPKYTGAMYYDIKKSFLGGHTDLYIPYGENLNHYDVNSLYPYVMAKKDMPMAPIRWFDGNILLESLWCS